MGMGWRDLQTMLEKNEALSVLTQWSYFYFDEQEEDALENTQRHYMRRKDAIADAGDYEFTLCKIMVISVRRCKKLRKRE